MDMVTIDRTKHARKTVLLTHEEVAAVTAYRRAQEVIPSESAALAELIRKGLERFKDEEKEAVRRRS